MSNGIAGDQLRSILERVERVQAEIDGLNSDKSEIFKEAKSNGFNTKVIKKILKIRSADPIEREEEDAVLDLYLHALGMAPDGVVRARVETIDEFQTHIAGFEAGKNSIRDSEASPPAEEGSQLAPNGDAPEASPENASEKPPLDAADLPEGANASGLYSNHVGHPLADVTAEGAKPAPASQQASSALIAESKPSPAEGPTEAEEGARARNVSTRGKAEKLPIPARKPDHFGSYKRSAEIPEMPPFLRRGSKPETGAAVSENRNEAVS